MKIVGSLFALLALSRVASTFNNDDDGLRDLRSLDLEPQKDLPYLSDEDAIARNFRFQRESDGHARRLDDENTPGVRVYGLPKKSFQDNGNIERIPLISSRFAEDDKPGIRAFGLAKLFLQNSKNVDERPSTVSRFAGDPRSGYFVEAYGMPKKNLEDNGRIERVQISTVPRAQVENSMHNSEKSLKNLEEQNEEMPRSLVAYGPQSSSRRRNGRLVEAYGMPRKPLNDNGWLEITRQSSPPEIERIQRTRGFRVARSIDNDERKNESRDLEGQDAKVFRPLFVYRQQVAARQKRLQRKRMNNNATNYYPQPTSKPYVHWKSHN